MSLGVCLSLHQLPFRFCVVLSSFEHQGLFEFVIIHLSEFKKKKAFGCLCCSAGESCVSFSAGASCLCDRCFSHRAGRQRGKLCFVAWAVLLLCLWCPSLDRSVSRSAHLGALHDSCGERRVSSNRCSCALSLYLSVLVSIHN